VFRHELLVSDAISCHGRSQHAHPLGRATAVQGVRVVLCERILATSEHATDEM
jgi:hypothetical protein